MKRISVMGWLIMLAMFTFAQKNVDTIPLKYGAHRTGNRTDSDMQRWRSHGLGQFITFGIYSMVGAHWEGKSYNNAAEWVRSWSGASAPSNWQNTYDNLYKQFNPTGFDANKWAKQAKDMGAKYLIFTTKFHDGFSLWPSKYTAYNISNTPYKRDIVKQVVDAYDANGIDVFLYFSIMDWNHPGYSVGVPKTEKDSVAFNEFKQFTRNQLIELLKNYPKIKGFWFDGTWDAGWVKESKFADELEKELRALHPGLIIGSRFRADENGKRHFDSNGKMMGDYEQGWERKLPANIEVLNGRDWDCVMTMAPNQWGYNSDWKSSYIKTSTDLIDMLLHAVSMNGNFVINFGPQGDGTIRIEETKIATELGNWTKINAEAIYGVRYSGLQKPDYGYYTKKENKLFLTVMNTPINGLLRLPFPSSFKQRPINALLLENKTKLNMKRVDMGMSEDNHVYYDIQLPINLKVSSPFVVIIELNEAKITTTYFGDAKI